MFLYIYHYSISSVIAEGVSDGIFLMIGWASSSSDSSRSFQSSSYRDYVKLMTRLGSEFKLRSGHGGLGGDISFISSTGSILGSILRGFWFYFYFNSSFAFFSCSFLNLISCLFLTHSSSFHFSSSFLFCSYSLYYFINLNSSYSFISSTEGFLDPPINPWVLLRCHPSENFPHSF